MAQPPREVKKGDPIESRDYNKIIKELRRLGKVFDTLPGNKTKSLRLDQVWFGTIVDAGPASEADYTDSRYWVSRSEIDLDQTDAETVEISFAKYISGTDYKHEIVTATNLAEVTLGSHHLSVDSPVVMLKFFDGGSPSTPRYFFWSTPKNFVLFPVNVTQTGGAAGGASKCSFTYTANDILTGAELGTVLSPEYDLRTASGSYVAGDKGFGYLDEANVFQLWTVNEVFDLGAC